MLQTDIRVSQQIGLMVGSGQQLCGDGTALEQAADPPRHATAHRTILTL